MELRQVWPAEYGGWSGWKPGSLAAGGWPNALHGELRFHRLPGSAVEVDSGNRVFRKSKPRPAGHWKRQQHGLYWKPEQDAGRRVLSAGSHHRGGKRSGVGVYPLPGLSPLPQLSDDDACRSWQLSKLQCANSILEEAC